MVRRNANQLRLHRRSGAESGALTLDMLSLIMTVLLYKVKTLEKVYSRQSVITVWYESTLTEGLVSCEGGMAKRLIQDFR